jgi:aspartyl-tRNA(Asn)/glutamyl-tRNA(Gln) amidotransferase subunit C
VGISRHEVEKVALLARLYLAPEELEQMACQLTAILDYMQLLNEVDTSGVEPLAHPLEISNVFREDEARPGLARDEALANAPSRDEECFRVPPVLGEF